MTDLFTRLRRALNRKPDTTRVKGDRITFEALLQTLEDAPFDMSVDASTARCGAQEQDLVVLEETLRSNGVEKKIPT